MYNDYFNIALKSLKNSSVKQAMEYSLYSSGKKLRSRLLIETCNAYGFERQHGYPAACALEMIHTYSLIHDDLPAMDDDDLRRGQPTCHKQFDEATAILAGDGLLTEAFSHIAHSYYTNDVKLELIRCLADASGANGMILGQDLDMQAKACSLEDLYQIHKYKTGKLFAASFMMGAICALRFKDLDKLATLGYTLGLAFQVQDDILDATMTSEDLGKDANSDVANDKKTILSFKSLAEAEILMNELYDKCFEIIQDIEWDYLLLSNLIGEIKNRKK